MTSWRRLLPRRWAARRRTDRTRRTDDAVRALRDAADSADAQGIAALLSKTATLTTDAGASALLGASSAPAAGPVVVAHALLSLLDSFPGRTLALHDVNGAAGLLVRSEGRVVGIIAVALRAHLVTHIWAIVNPDKLAHWNRT